jgi:hypothetical protein
MLKCTAIGLLALGLGFFSRATAETRCVELEGAKALASLEYLQRDRSTLIPVCITQAMFQIALATDPKSFDRYAEAVKTIVGYLDYRLPDESPLDRMVPRNRDPYPASDALSGIGKPVVPDLIETIGNPATRDIVRGNATLAVFAIYSRGDLPEAVRLLRRASEAPEHFDGSERLFDAAKWIATKCRDAAAYDCQVALYGADAGKKHQ